MLDTKVPCKWISVTNVQQRLDCVVDQFDAGRLGQQSQMIGITKQGSRHADLLIALSDNKKLADHPFEIVVPKGSPAPIMCTWVTTHPEPVGIKVQGQKGTHYVQAEGQQRICVRLDARLIAELGKYPEYRV